MEGRPVTRRPVSRSKTDAAPIDPDFTLIVPIGELLHDDATDVIELPFDVPAGAWSEGASLSGRLSGVATLARTGDGILVTLSDIAGERSLTCVRCLTPLVRSFSLPRAMCLFVTLPGEQPDMEGLDLARQQLDLRPLLREELLVVTPQTPLCRPDCPGLCQRCGVSRSDRSCTCPREDMEPKQLRPLSNLSKLWDEHHTP